MSIWDEYCVVCHGPLYNQLKKGNIVSNPKCYKKINTENNVFVEQNNGDYIVAENQHQYNWLNKLFGITNKDEIIKFSSWHYTGNGAFKIKQNKLFIIHGHENEFAGDNMTVYVGIVCHADCYHYLKKQKFNLTFSSIKKELTNNCLFKKQQYGHITRYCKKFFNFYDSCVNKGWILESPLKNKKNAERINKIWYQYILKTNKKYIKNK